MTRAGSHRLLSQSACESGKTDYASHTRDCSCCCREPTENHAECHLFVFGIVTVFVCHFESPFVIAKNMTLRFALNCQGDTMIALPDFHTTVHHFSCCRRSCFQQTFLYSFD